MTISSRTPEGDFGNCPVCHQKVVVDPSTVPTRDASCPHCGHLIFFRNADWDDVQRLIDIWEQRRKELEAERAPAAEPEPVGPTVALALHSLDDPTEMQNAEDLFWQHPE